MMERRRFEPRALVLTLALAALPLLVASAVQAQGVVPRDWCGCEGVPNLGAFVSSDPTTWPTVEGQPTRLDSGAIFIPLPADGVLVFESFTVDGLEGGGGVDLAFDRNDANTPATILSVGDITVASGSRLTVNGSTGGGALDNIYGRGSRGGPGGFRGGNGIQISQFPGNQSEAGAGPGGGASRTARVAGANASYVASFLPLVGGSGGSGAACDTTGGGSAGGGGGGGGGALLIAANGTLTIDGQLSARGGNGGGGEFSCSRGGHGSGGTLRILATTVTGSGSLDVGSSGASGRVRVEALSNELPTSAYLQPTRFSTRGAPGPLRNPLAPRVSITSVGGEGVVAPTLGWRGPEDGLGPHIDVLVPSAGPVDVALQTSGVPSGTNVNVVVKPRPGASLTQAVLLDVCDTAGVCDALATFDLAEGDYTIEARATFQAP